MINTVIFTTIHTLFQRNVSLAGEAHPVGADCLQGLVPHLLGCFQSSFNSGRAFLAADISRRPQFFLVFEGFFCCPRAIPPSGLPEPSGYTSHAPDAGLFADPTVQFGYFSVRLHVSTLWRETRRLIRCSALESVLIIQRTSRIKCDPQKCSALELVLVIRRTLQVFILTTLLS